MGHAAYERYWLSVVRALCGLTLGELVEAWCRRQKHGQCRFVLPDICAQPLLLAAKSKATPVCRG